MKTQKLRRKDTILVAIDFQEKLMPAMKMADEIEENMAKLIKGCRVLQIPIIVTQQYTKGLGMTTQKLQDAFSKAIGEDAVETEFCYIDKTSFSALGEPAFVTALEATGKKNVIITGVEAHICVQQTVIDLLEKGYNVFVVNNCISSRDNTDKKYSQRRMSDAGAIGTTFEAVLFELVGGAKELGFKQISNLVK